MSARRVAGAVAAFGMVGAGAVGLAAGGAAAPAQAFTGSCGTSVPAATLIADGVCEVRIAATGPFGFTPPSGITKLAAVLVGGGGGAGLDVSASSSYAGNGGHVVYIDSLPLGGPLAGTVGAGGAASQNTSVANGAPSDGGPTLVGATPAAGGFAANNGQANCVTANWDYWFGNGANTGGDSASCLPGVGFTLSQLSGVDTTLFPGSLDGTDVYGNGGPAGATDPGLVNPVRGSGGSVSDTLAAPGSDGLVIFRFAAAPTLAATGSAVSWTVPGISAAMVAAGALLLALRRRRPAQH
ncbi:MAG: hypothetical protein ABIS08_11275 [Pseudolysinimonas sp.]